MTITLHDQTFPLRELEFDFGIRLVSTEDLNEMIMDQTGNYKSEKARIIDEEIFYYVSSSEIRMDDEELKELIINQMI